MWVENCNRVDASRWLTSSGARRAMTWNSQRQGTSAMDRSTAAGASTGVGVKVPASALALIM